MNKELFISKRSALELIDLGFDTSKCIKAVYYTTDNKFVNAEVRNAESFEEPNVILWQQAFDFFREKYNLVSSIDCYTDTHHYFYQIRTNKSSEVSKFYKMDGFINYDFCKEMLVKQLIYIVKNAN